MYPGGTLPGITPLLSYSLPACLPPPSSFPLPVLAGAATLSEWQSPPTLPHSPLLLSSRWPEQQPSPLSLLIVLPVPLYHPSLLLYQGGHIAGAINIPEGDCLLPTVNLTLSTIPKNKVRSHFALETQHHLLPRVH